MTENKRSVLFFDTHPDDADWWSGGLAILLREKGWAVDFVCVAPAKENRGYADESASILGVTRHYLEIPVNDNDRFRGCLREAVLPLMETHKPDMVFIPAMTDYHREHVLVSKTLFSFFHWSAGLGLGEVEVYSCDSHETRDLVEIYIDVSSVWKKHMESLRCFKNFKCPTSKENTLIRVKTGRAMMLGATIPSHASVDHAEGYCLMQGNVKCISSLAGLFPDQFYYRNPKGLMSF